MTPLTPEERRQALLKRFAQRLLAIRPPAEAARYSKEEVTKFGNLICQKITFHPASHFETIELKVYPV
jgi:hypothetical protein